MSEMLMGPMTVLTIQLLITLAGAGLGTVFYGGLWWTVSRVATVRQPGLWVLGSLLLRMAIAVGGFYFVAGGDWARLLPCLLGFVLSRVAVSWATRLPMPAPVREPNPSEASHAP